MQENEQGRGREKRGWRSVSRLRRGLRLRGWLAVGAAHVSVLNRAFRLELVFLVVVVLEHNLDPLRWAIFEVQRVVRVGIGGEPVLPVDLLAISFEFRELLIFAPAQVA